MFKNASISLNYDLTFCIRFGVSCKTNKKSVSKPAVALEPQMAESFASDRSMKVNICGPSPSTRDCYCSWKALDTPLLLKA
jgi:hypothetical protein